MTLSIKQPWIIVVCLVKYCCCYHSG